MFEHVVVYSPLSAISPQFVQKLGLIYDRVVIPLPDAIRSGHVTWLNELATHCEYTKAYLNGLQAVYSDDSGFCRPLQTNDYRALTRDSEAFRSDFFRFVEGNISRREWTDLVSVAIDVAQDVLNYFVTQDYAMEQLAETGSMPNFIFPFRDDNGTGGAVISKIASVLRVEATRCALHGFDLPNSAGEFTTILRLTRSLESKFWLKQRLYDAECEIEAAIREGVAIDIKDVLRKHALAIAKSYNSYIEDLERYNKVVKVRRNAGSNSLRVARRLVRPKFKAKIVGKWDFFSVVLGLDDQYTNEHRELLKQAEEAVLDAKHRWQCDLLTLRCDVDREFGRKETYKVLTPGFWDFVLSKIA